MMDEDCFLAVDFFRFKMTLPVETAKKVFLPCLFPGQSTVENHA
jgi:hypothetical protein